VVWDLDNTHPVTLNARYQKARAWVALRPPSMPRRVRLLTGGLRFAVRCTTVVR
jgi:hypothetical protein